MEKINPEQSRQTRMQEISSDLNSSSAEARINAAIESAKDNWYSAYANQLMAAMANLEEVGQDMMFDAEKYRQAYAILDSMRSRLVYLRTNVPDEYKGEPTDDVKRQFLAAFEGARHILFD